MGLVALCMLCMLALAVGRWSSSLAALSRVRRVVCRVRQRRADKALADACRGDDALEAWAVECGVSMDMFSRSEHVRERDAGLWAGLAVAGRPMVIPSRWHPLPSLSVPQCCTCGADLAKGGGPCPNGCSSFVAAWKVVEGTGSTAEDIVASLAHLRKHLRK